MTDDREVPERIGSFRVLRVLGEGAAGVVYAVQREESNTVSALKVLHPTLNGTKVIERFRREAEVLRRLRHPGIAAFYDAGDTRVATATGSAEVPYLSLEYVDGEPPAQHALRAQLEVEGRIELLARIADALHHAHEAGVVHRDLKPSNVLVAADDADPVGRPKLLDFGVARTAETDLTTIDTTDRALLGTVPYMSPEQVSGSAVDRRSDVYALGVLAYELLSGRLPYDVKGRPLPAAVRAIRGEEPTRLGRIARDLDRDVQHVVAQALEKDPARRYATAADLAHDLRAAAAGRTVQARAPGVVRRTRRWSRRHPVAATVLLLGGVGLALVLALWRNATDARDGAREQAVLAGTRAVEAAERLTELERERASLLLLADREELATLERLEDELWPAHPNGAPAMREWIARAEAVDANFDAHAAVLATFDDATSEPADDGRSWWRAGQEQLVERLEALRAPSGPLERMRERLRTSETLRERTLDAHADLWRETVRAIRESPRYGGLELAPQIGLVPLGEDPTSELHEFWHVASGARPERDADRWIVDPGTGIVLVLIPGGTFAMGAQADDPDAPNYDPLATPMEIPVHEVTLSPYFIAKHELTQAQWLRVERNNPSSCGKNPACAVDPVVLSAPVETVSWEEVARALARLDLALPTEAQWELAARGGVEAPWSCGDPSALAYHANIADQVFLEQGGHAQDRRYEAWDDGFSCVAPVGSYAPNPFGLHDVHGNVWEWCEDTFIGYFYEDGPRVDPIAAPTGAAKELPYRILRGGCYSTHAELGRSASRMFFDQSATRYSAIGVRAARAVRAAE